MNAPGLPAPEDVGFHLWQTLADSALTECLATTSFSNLHRVNEDSVRGPGYDGEQQLAASILNVVALSTEENPSCPGCHSLANQKGPPVRR